MSSYHIIHAKFSGLASAPDEVVHILQRHGKYHYSLVCGASQKKLREHLLSILRREPNMKFLIHFHNKFCPLPRIPNCQKVIQYHSEPKRAWINHNFARKLVLNQYHCTLPFYRSCEHIVRNTIDLKRICPNWKKPQFCKKGIKIVYIPSILVRANEFHDKGYQETKPILERIQRKFPKKVRLVILKKVPYNKSIQEKREAHIVIDECKTGSFHKTSIEGLSFGAIVFAKLSLALQEKHMHLYGRLPPIENVGLDKLEDRLIEWVVKGKEAIEEEAIKRWEDFISYWSPQHVARDFDAIYEEVIACATPLPEDEPGAFDS